jgi:hypothetical protein
VLQVQDDQEEEEEIMIEAIRRFFDIFRVRAQLMAARRELTYVRDRLVREEDFRKRAVYDAARHHAQSVYDMRQLVGIISRTRFILGAHDGEPTEQAAARVLNTMKLSLDTAHQCMTTLHSSDTSKVQ